MMFRFLLCFYLMEYYGIHARTSLEIKAWLFKQGIECIKDNPITPEEITMLKEHKMPDSKNAKCTVACIYKRSGMMDSKGMFDIANTIDMTNKDYADDPNKQENAKKVMETCKKVNDEAVTDGEKGCERAELMHKCIHENASLLGIQLP